MARRGEHALPTFSILWLTETHCKSFRSLGSQPGNPSTNNDPLSASPAFSTSSTITANARGRMENDGNGPNSCVYECIKDSTDSQHPYILSPSLALLLLKLPKKAYNYASWPPRSYSLVIDDVLLLAWSFTLSSSWYAPLSSHDDTVIERE